MNICIIPARGGSKRIIYKNIRNFLGKPIIAYSIDLAIKSNLFDRVIVSTDDKKIAEVSVEYGAEVLFMRPKNLSDDFTGTHEVIRHAVEWFEGNESKIDYACCIYATAPLLQVNDLEKGFELIKTKKWEAVISATNFSYPIFRSFEKNRDNGLKMFFPEHYLSRSQDLPEAYHDAGQFYWSPASVWKGDAPAYGSKVTTIELPNHRVRDIDSEDDWKIAECIYTSLNITES